MGNLIQKYIIVITGIFLWLGNWEGIFAVEFYVATDGNDNSSGTISQPFATLEGARNAIRKGKTSGSIQDGVMVWIRGGTYSRSTTFQLTNLDSAANGSQITYAGYSNEVARIVGGKILTGFAPVTDSSVLSRLPASAKGNVLVVNLRANGITNFGNFTERGMGLNLPSAPSHLELFFNGNVMTVARWPNDGQWDYISGFPVVGEKSATEGSLTNGFIYSGNRPNSWKNPTNIWVHGYWDNDWADSYERISSIELGSQWIKTAPPYGQYGFVTGQRFYYLNVLEELDQPGEYYTDTANGLLYFWPPSSIATGEAMASVLETPLVDVEYATNVVFSNLTFQATRGLGFNFKGAVANLLSKLTICDIGDVAVNVNGGLGCCVVNCEIHDIGDAGVILSGGDRNTLTPSGHLIQNCHLNNIARWSRTFQPAIKLSGVGQRAANNLVENHPHNAIWFDGNDHIIEYNELRNVVYETGDSGAIYGGRDYSYRGNIIRYNYLHDIYGGGMWGARGVYNDDCLSGTHIYGNVFLNVSNAVFIGGGRDITVENNIFINSNPSVVGDARGLSTDPGWASLLPTLKQRLYAVPGALYRLRYPAISTLDHYFTNNLRIPPENNVIRLNICTGNNFLHFDSVSLPYIGINSNSISSNPGFINISSPLAGQYQLSGSASIVGMGFSQIPFTSIGTNLNLPIILTPPNSLRVKPQ